MSTLNLGKDNLILDSDIVEDGVEYSTGATYRGKPVYRMSGVKTGTWTFSNDINLVAITNLSKVLFISAITHLSGGVGFVQIPYIYSSNGSELTEYAAVWSNGGEIHVHLKRAQGFENVNWTVYYTKTTD